MPGERRRAGRKLRDQRAVLGHLPGQAPVSARIDPVQAVGGDRHGAPATGQRAAVAGAVDADRQTAGDGQSAAGERGAEGVGGLEAAGRGVAAADHGHLGHAQHGGVAVHEQHRRRVGDLPEQRGVGARGEGHQVSARGLEPSSIGVDRVPVRGDAGGGDEVARR